jgi:hypothetical protein
MWSKTYSCTIPWLPPTTSEQPVNLQRELLICIKVWNKSAKCLLFKHSLLYILLYPWCFGLIKRVLVPANTCMTANKIKHPIKITWYFVTCCILYMERVNWVHINQWWKLGVQVYHSFQSHIRETTVLKNTVYDFCKMTLLQLQEI